MKKLNLCVDLYGCPNRCKHCWLGQPKHVKMEDHADTDIVDFFKPYFDRIAFYSWFREPDMTDRYEERWEMDQKISVNAKPQRFELASFYRLCRDSAYAGFLSRIGIKKVQLTFFGMEEMTDRYVGRKGAFKELLSATDILINHGIAPRYQAFLNRENKDDIVRLLDFIEETDLKKRCETTGVPFEFFVHEGSCEGENRKLYDIRIAKEEIPRALIEYHIGYDRLRAEKEFCELLKDDASPYVYHNEDEITLYITSDYNVYYHFTNLSENWKIGNMKSESAESLAAKIIREDTFALNEARKISIGELAKRYGDFRSDKAFALNDYKSYLLNSHIESLVR